MRAGLVFLQSHRSRFHEYPVVALPGEVESEPNALTETIYLAVIVGLFREEVRNP
jgi:hypothetical protein